MKRSTLVFAATTTFAGVAVVYAHWAQVRDKKEMHKAVIRDKEKLRQKRLALKKNDDDTTR